MTDLILIGTDENGIETYLDPNTNDLFQEDFEGIDGLGFVHKRLKKGFKKIGRAVGNGYKFGINNSGASWLKKKITGTNLVPNSKFKGKGWQKLDRKADGFRNAMAITTLAVAGGAAAKGAASAGKIAKFGAKLKPLIGKGTIGKQLLNKGGELLNNRLLPGQQVPAGFVPEQVFDPQGFIPKIQQGLVRQGPGALPPAKKDNTMLYVAGGVGLVATGAIIYALTK